MEQKVKELMNKMDSELKMYEQHEQKFELQGSTGPNGSIHRFTASNRASDMIDYRWTIRNGNLTAASGTTIPSYLSNKKVGDSINLNPL